MKNQSKTIKYGPASSEYFLYSLKKAVRYIAEGSVLREQTELVIKNLEKTLKGGGL